MSDKTITKHPHHNTIVQGGIPIGSVPIIQVSTPKSNQVSIPKREKRNYTNKSKDASEE